MSRTHLPNERMIENGVLAARSGRDGDEHVLRLSGELDLSSYELLNAELRRVEATDVSRIVIDLSGLTFLDSVGIRLLVEADARSRADGSRLQLIPGGDQVQRILQLCGLEETLPFVSENGLAGSASEAPRPMRPVI
jgi:anti-anti-sigma factor